MKKAYKIVLLVLLFLAAAAYTVYYVRTNSVPVLEPKGMIGEKERDLIITSSLLMLIVVIPVFILTCIRLDLSGRQSESEASSRLGAQLHC